MNIDDNKFKEPSKAPKKKLQKLFDAIETAINQNSIEQYTNTPDYILAAYLINCYKSYEDVTIDDYEWFAEDMK